MHMSNVGKALIAIGKALTTQNRNGHRQTVRYKVQQPKSNAAPYHWHMVFGKTKYVMDYVGLNNRTGKKVYQCPFCGGKAERRWQRNDRQGNFSERILLVFIPLPIIPLPLSVIP